jgi:hypothetical protein
MNRGGVQRDPAGGQEVKTLGSGAEPVSHDCRSQYDKDDERDHRPLVVHPRRHDKAPE